MPANTRGLSRPDHGTRREAHCSPHSWSVEVAGKACGLLASLLLVGCAASPMRMLPSVPVSVVAPSEEDHSEEHGAGTQAVNFFFGGSNEVGDQDGITYGLDYEYRLAPEWGVGGFAEAITGLDRSFATGIQAYWHPIGELVLVAGPGVERLHDEWGAIARVGVFYEFSLGGHWVLSPALFYDFTEHENLLIYGVNLGYVW